jgi:uncharacterized membrane protein YdfJ with MMPL/SSD domain
VSTAGTPATGHGKPGSWWEAQPGRVCPNDAPSIKAMKRMGEDFKESNSDSVAMIVLEGQQPLGDDAHQYYDRLIRQLEEIRSMCSTSRISGAIHSRRRARKAPMVRPRMCN